MGLLTSLLRAQTLDRSPGSDFWYMPVGAISKAGVRINQENVLRIAAVLQGVRFVCQTVGMLPRFVFRRGADRKSRDKDHEHPLNRLLRFEPNAWQTPMQFTELLTAFAMLRGIGAAEKVFDSSGEIAELRPIMPDRLQKIEQREDGKLRFRLRSSDGSPRTLLQEEVFWISGFGVSGVKGLELVDQMRETAGLSLAMQGYGSSFFRNSAMPRVVLTTKNELKPETRHRMREDWNRTYRGDNQHGTALLEGETNVEVLSTKNDEAQFVEANKFIIAEFARHLDVTPHRLSDLERATFSNIEEMSLESVIYTLTPWVVRWEQSAFRDLLMEEEKARGDVFVEFSIDGLLRGDSESRAKFYQSGIFAGWLTRNEVREKENHNPLEGLDEPLQPTNQIPVSQVEELGNESPPSGGGEGSQPDDGANEEELRGKAAPIAVAASARVIRREQAAVQKLIERSDNGFPTEAVESFYRAHVDFLCKALLISEEAAKRWCLERARQAKRGTIDYSGLPVYELASLALETSSEG